MFVFYFRCFPIFCIHLFIDISPLKVFLCTQTNKFVLNFCLILSERQGFIKASLVDKACLRTLKKDLESFER